LATISRRCRLDSIASSCPFAAIETMENTLLIVLVPRKVTEQSVPHRVILGAAGVGSRENIGVFGDFTQYPANPEEGHERWTSRGGLTHGSSHMKPVPFGRPERGPAPVRQQKP